MILYVVSLRLFAALLFFIAARAFVPHASSKGRIARVILGGDGRPRPTCLNGMRRPILDRMASKIFQLEQDRVESSSVVDDKGRVGEPMEWSERGSLANTASEIMAGPGYAFKQFVADVVAGEFEEEVVGARVDEFVMSADIVMFSFSTCPFCRRAKDYLGERGIPYESMELDELEGNAGNEIRAVLGRKTRRTSVPSIFVKGEFIGGCNDGPGLLTIAESGELDNMLAGKL